MNISQIRQELEDAAFYGNMTKERYSQIQEQWNQVKESYPDGFHALIEDRLSLAKRYTK